MRFVRCLNAISIFNVCQVCMIVRILGNVLKVVFVPFTLAIVRCQGEASAKGEGKRRPCVLISVNVVVYVEICARIQYRQYADVHYFTYLAKHCEEV